MKNILLLPATFFMSFVFAQSKNVQIDLLNKKNDSILTLLSQERMNWSSNEVNFRKQIDSFQLALINKDIYLKECNESLNNSLLKNKELSTKQEEDKNQIIGLQKSMSTLTQENSKLKTNLKSKTDSISFLMAEVNKYKPIEKANCTEKTVKVSGSPDPTYITTCTFRQYKFVTTSEADYKGRYSDFTEVFKKSGESYVKIANHDIFNTEQRELLSMINKNALKEYNELSSDPENADCFQEQSFQEYESLDDVGIYIKDSSLGIYYSFGLGGACMSVDGGGMTLPISTIEKYLK
jgi:chromosome segregation ATPase